MLVLRAKLRQRHDRDIEQAVERLDLEKGELSDMVRDGFRKMLIERGVLIGKTTERYRGGQGQH